MSTAILFILACLFITEVSGDARNTVDLYKILISHETDEAVKDEYKKILNESKKRSKKYLIAYIILLVISLGILVSDLISRF